MPKTLISAAIVFVLLVAAAISALAWKAITIMDPYIVPPVTVSRASPGAFPGHSIDANTRTLSVVSSQDVTLIADPGVSFLYEEVWLVARPRDDQSDVLREYKFKLPDYAAPEHINPIGTPIPPRIERLAD